MLLPWLPHVPEQTALFLNNSKTDFVNLHPVPDFLPLPNNSPTTPQLRGVVPRESCDTSPTIPAL